MLEAATARRVGAIRRQALLHSATWVVTGRGWYTNDLLRDLAVEADTKVHVLAPATDAVDINSQLHAWVRAGRTRPEMLVLDARLASSADDRWVDELALALDYNPAHDCIVCLTRALPSGARFEPHAGTARRGPADDQLVLFAEPLRLVPSDATPGPLAETVVAAIHSGGGWPLHVMEQGESGGGLAAGPAVTEVVHRSAARLDAAAAFALDVALHLPWVNADVLDAAGAAPATEALLSLLAEGVLLQQVGRTDQHHATYACPPVVRELLDGRRKALPTERVVAVSQEYLAAGDLHAALQVADSSAPGPALEALRRARDEGRLRAVSSSVEPSRLSQTVATVLAHAPEPDRIWLEVLAADLRAAEGDWDEAMARYLALLDEATQAQAGVGDDEVELIRLKIVRLAYYRGDLELVYDHVGRIDLQRASPRWVSIALSSRGVAHWMGGERDAARADAAQARAQAPEGDALALTYLETLEALLAATAGNREANRVHGQLALDHARAAGDDVQVMRILGNRASAHIEEGRYLDAVAACEEALDAAQRSGQHAFGGMIHLNHAQALRALGRTDDAALASAEALRIWRRNGSAFVAYALVQRATVHLEREETQQARLAFDEALAGADAHGYADVRVDALLGLARLELTAGRGAQARALAETALEHATSLNHAGSSVVLAEALVRLGREAEASVLLHEAVRAARATNNQAVLAQAMVVLGSLGSAPDPSMVNEAVRLWREMGNAVEAARATVVLGALTGGEPGLGLVRAAQQTLSRLGVWAALREASTARTALERSLAGAAQPDAAASSEPDLLVVRVLGATIVEREGVPVPADEWGPGGALAVFAALVCALGDRVDKSELRSWLGQVARLEAELDRLRELLDPDASLPPHHYVAEDGDAVWLRSEHVELDLAQLVDAARTARSAVAEQHDAEARAWLVRAHRLYRGELFADLDPAWVFPPITRAREQARRSAIAVTHDLAALARRANNEAEARRWYQRTLELDPLDDAAHLGLVRGHAEGGRLAEARRAYAVYADRLAEVGRPPQPVPWA